MVVSSIQELLAHEQAMRSGGTAAIRETAMESVINIAFNHPDGRLRKHAAGHLRTRGMEIVYAKG